jgi:hypothetical protein
MSFAWKYIRTLSNLGKNNNQSMINKIEYSHKLECNPPIHIWNVKMKDGNIYDLNDKIFRNLEKFNKNDQEIIFQALENSKKITKADYLEIYSKIF